MLKNKLMHDKVSTLIDHLNSINYEFYNWWNESDVVKSKDFFCNKFASKSFTTEKLKNAIININK